MSNFILSDDNGEPLNITDKLNDNNIKDIRDNIKDIRGYYSLNNNNINKLIDENIYNEYQNYIQKIR